MHARLAATLAAALLVGGLAGCSSNSAADAKPAAVSASPTVDKANVFLTSVKAAAIGSWTDTGPTDEELLAYPDQWCTGLAAGHSAEYLLDLHQGGLYPIGNDWGTYRADANTVFVLGVTAYCPQYRAQVVEELQASGDY
jgi:hypothetical protein